jgi:nucleoside-diphosphate-sugar epimerase
MKILVTGATGLLGRRLVAELAPSHALRVLVRPAKAAAEAAGTAAGGTAAGGARSRTDSGAGAAGAGSPAPGRATFPPGVEVVAGDVTDAGSVRRAVEGCEAVVHAAALVKILAPAAEFDRVNVGGLENVLAAAAAAGVERIVYVSTFMALGPSEHGPGGVLDESAAEPPAAGTAAGAGGSKEAPRPGAAAEPADRSWINSYERTKTIADRLARRAIAAGQPLAVVYPGVIYGPGEMTEGNLVVRHVLDLLHRRLPALLGKPKRRWCYVFVDDVARGIAQALERGSPGGRYVLGGENVALADFYALVEELSGVPVPKRRLPDGLAKAIGAAQKGWARLRGTTPALTPDLVEVYRHDWAYSSARAAAELGYTFRPLREGLTATLAWLQETGQWRR